MPRKGSTKPGKMEREKPTKGKAGKTVKKGTKKGGPGKRGRFEE